MKEYYSANGVTFYAGDVRAVWDALPAASVQCVVTSVPYYGLRSYSTEPQVWGGAPDCLHEWGVEGKSAQRLRNGIGSDTAKVAMSETLHPSTGAFCTRCAAWRGELGREPTPDLFVAHIVAVFRSVRRVLRPDGTLWLNVGDSYSNDSKWGGATGGKHVAGLHGQTGIGRQKRVTGLGDGQLLMIPARVAIALQDDGWVLRNELIGAKTAPMPESVQDRFTRAHEQIYVFAARRRYFMDMAAIKEPASKGAAGSTFTAGKTGVNGHGRVSELPREDATGRNPRDWFLWAPEPTSVAHYAAFPSAIPRLAILAGTSAAGACPACGAAWRRVVERSNPRLSTEYQAIDNTPKAATGTGVRNDYGTNKTGLAKPGWRKFGGPSTQTIDWQPACKCNAGAPVPCLAGDPFVGSGTTARVAYSLGRHFVGGDLNPQYLDLAIAGMRDVTPWYAAAPDPATDLDGLPLFAQVPA
jgi:DNA modification methylase